MSTDVIAGVSTAALWRVARSHGVIRMQVFGSWARGDAHADSDLDLLVKLERGRSLLDVVALQRELEAVAGRKVDVVTEGALSRYLRERVLQEARPL